MSGPGQVLIVDDEEYNRDVLAQELDALGHKSLPAEDGKVALDKLATNSVDLVLLDIQMPKVDGYEVLKRLKTDAKLRHVPVIMISALSDMASITRCIEMGAEDYLPKPFDPVLLKARVGASLEKKRLHDQEAAQRQTIEKQLQEIKRERQHSDRLLHAIFPGSAVRELKSTSHVVPRRYEGVAVLFSDIIGSTSYCDSHPPEEVVANLSDFFEACELVVAEHGLELIKTTGDGCLVTGNLMMPSRDPILSAVRCAFDMIKAATESPAGWQVRVGIHTGAVVSGVVGRDKMSFDLWGDTVNIAARLSGIGSSSAVNLSREAWSAVSSHCDGTPLGAVPIRGKGDMEVFRCDRVRS